VAWISNSFLDAGNVGTRRHTLFSLAQRFSELLNFGAGNPDLRAWHLLTTHDEQGRARTEAKKE
jgi:hypothetical protein